MSSPDYSVIRHTSANSIASPPRLPAHIAAFNNDTIELANLIENGGDLVDEKTGETPFHAAARTGSINAIQWMLENCPNLSPRDKAHNGHTPAHVAAVYGHMEALKAILEYNKSKKGLIAAEQDKNGLTILHLAVLQGDDQMVKYILKQCPHLGFCSNEHGQYPVHFAAASGFLNIIKILVEVCGGDIVKEKDTNGTTAVYFAAQEGKLDCLLYFLEELQADPISKDNDGMTLLHAAAQANHMEIVQYLVSMLDPRDIKAVTNDGATVIHTATDEGSTTSAALLSFLLSQPGCDDLVNAQDINGYTPTHDAIEFNKVDILVVLLKNGADLTLRNTDGKTPMDYANDATTVKLLEDFQNKGETILSQYSGLPKTTDHLVGFSLGRRGSHTKASIHSPPNIIQQSRTLDHVKVDIEHAKTAASELTAQRELRQQESKKALESAGIAGSDEEDPIIMQKPDPQVSSGGVNRYITDDGAVYSMVQKSKVSKGGRLMERKVSPKKVSKPSSGGQGSDFSDFSSPLSQQLSAQGRTNRTSSPHLVHQNGSVYSDEDQSNFTSVSQQMNRQSGSRSNISGYRNPSGAYPGVGKYPPMGYPPGYPPYMYPGQYPHPGQYAHSSIEGRMRMDALQHGHRPPYPQPYMHYPPPMGRTPHMVPPPGAYYGRGFDYKAYRNMYPGGFPYYGGPVPQKKSPRAPSSTPGSKIGIPFGKKKKSKGESPGVPPGLMKRSHTDQDMGYGPIVSTDGPTSSKKKKNYIDGSTDEFHPAAPPITKDGKVNEYIERGGGNVIMRKPTKDTARTIEASGTLLHTAKKDYNAYYDDFIEEDPYPEEADEHFNIAVLIEAATVAILGSVAGVKDLTMSLSSIRGTKSKPPTKKKKHSKTHSVQDMWKDDVSAEKASMNSHDPMGYSYAEDQRIKRRDKKGRQQEVFDDVDPDDDDQGEGFITETLKRAYSKGSLAHSTAGMSIGISDSLVNQYRSMTNLAPSSLFASSHYSDGNDEHFGDIEDYTIPKPGEEAGSRQDQMQNMETDEKRDSESEKKDIGTPEEIRRASLEKESHDGRSPKSRSHDRKESHDRKKEHSQSPKTEPRGNDSSEAVSPKRGRAEEQRENAKRQSEEQELSVEFKGQAMSDLSHSESLNSSLDEVAMFESTPLPGKDFPKKEKSVSAKLSWHPSDVLQRELHVTKGNQIIVSQPEHLMDVTLDTQKKSLGESPAPADSSQDTLSIKAVPEGLVTEEVVIAASAVVQERTQKFSDDEDTHPQPKTPPPVKPKVKRPSSGKAAAGTSKSMEKTKSSSSHHKPKEKAQRTSEKPKKTSTAAAPKKVSSGGRTTPGEKTRKESTEKIKRKSETAATKAKAKEVNPVIKTSTQPQRDQQSTNEFMSMIESMTSQAAPPPDTGAFLESESMSNIMDGLSKQIAELEGMDLDFGLSDTTTAPPPKSEPLSSLGGGIQIKPESAIPSSFEDETPLDDDFEGNALSDLAQELERLGIEETSFKEFTKPKKVPPKYGLPRPVQAQKPSNLLSNKPGNLPSNKTEPLAVKSSPSNSSSPWGQASTPKTMLSVQNTPPPATPPTNPVIDQSVVQLLMGVNKQLTGSQELSRKELFQYQQQHNQLVSEIIRQVLSGREQGIDHEQLAQAIAKAISQLDHFTISQVLAGVNQGRTSPGTLSDVQESGLAYSDSSISLAGDIESAIRKVQEEQMKEQQKHFKSQAEFQRSLQKQIDDQMNVYQQMQEQTKIFVDMQSRQAEVLAQAQRKMDEQSFQWKETEQRLKDELRAKEDIERERKVKELETKLKMYENMKDQQQTYYKQLNEYYEQKMNEMKDSFMDVQRQGRENREEKVKKEKKSSTGDLDKRSKRLKKITKGLDLDDVSSSEDEMVAPAPPVKHVVQQHTVTKEHKAEIYKTAMLTEQTLKEILESKIPQPPQLPSQNYLLGKIKRTDTQTKIHNVYNALDKFEHPDYSDDEEEDGDEEFVQPVATGGMRKASLRKQQPAEVYSSERLKLDDGLSSSGSTAKLKRVNPVGSAQSWQEERHTRVQPHKPQKHLQHKLQVDTEGTSVEGAGSELKAALLKRQRH